MDPRFVGWKMRYLILSVCALLVACTSMDLEYTEKNGQIEGKAFFHDLTGVHNKVPKCLNKAQSALQEFCTRIVFESMTVYKYQMTLNYKCERKVENGHP